MRSIVTARLLLRPFTVGDVEDVWAYQRLDEVARYLTWEPRDRAQSEEAVAQMAKETELVKDGDCLSLAVISDDTVIGQVELVLLSKEHRQGEVGYVMNPDFGGKGLATEAARAILRVGFEEHDLHRIIGRCSAMNTSSTGLLRRLGMRQEACFVESRMHKGSWHNELVFAMLRAEWSTMDHS